MANRKKTEQKATSQILNETRNVLYGDNQVNESGGIEAVLGNLLAVLGRMDTKLSTIEKNTNQNTSTLKDMSDKLTSLTSRVITAEHDIKDVKDRVSELEANTEGTGNLFDEMKTKTEDLNKAVRDLRADKIDQEDEYQTVKEKLDLLSADNNALKEKLTDLQCRQMKYNLIFTGLLEQPEEDCEAKLRQFLAQEMNITQHVELGNVHRFGKKSDTYNSPPRPIVARFIYWRDLEAVKKAGKFLKGKHFGVNEQFPTEIEDRRKKLYPIMKEEKKKKSKVVLKRDKLYVNNELVVPADYPTGNRVEPRYNRQERKRTRVSSTPDRET